MKLLVRQQFETAYEVSTLIAYANSECSDEPAQTQVSSDPSFLAHTKARREWLLPSGLSVSKFISN